MSAYARRNATVPSAGTRVREGRSTTNFISSIFCLICLNYQQKKKKLSLIVDNC